MALHLTVTTSPFNQMLNASVLVCLVDRMRMSGASRNTEKREGRLISLVSRGHGIYATALH